MPPILEQPYGDLTLRFTSAFNPSYNDTGSRSHLDGSFWTPVPPDGFFNLGTYGQSGYENPNGQQWALCVKETTSGSGALAPPIRYDPIWNAHGTHGDGQGSFWRPVPPAGYVALGDVCVLGYNPPPLDAIRCVRIDLTYSGAIGALIWNDQGSGAPMDVGVWDIEVLPGASDQVGFIAANTFVAVKNYDTPVSDVSCNVLMLPFPSNTRATAGPPTLDGKVQPPDHTNPVVDRIVTVPFTAIADQQQTVGWQVANSPFYTIERAVSYSLVVFNNNLTSQSQTTSTAVTTGITQTETETFSQTTGITVSYEYGVQAFGASHKVSVALSLELGYAQSTSVSVMQSSTVVATLETPPQHAAASWAATHQLQLRRADGTPVGPPLTFDAVSSSFLEAQYPLPSGGARVMPHTVFAG